MVSLGPVGFLTTAYESVLGAAPWNIYSMLATALIVALTHVPHVYLYVAAALRLVPSDSEEAARVAGAGPWRTALTVTLPMVLPSIGVGAVLVFFLGFELFGLPYVLGDPEGRLVLSTYLYKLTTRLGTPSYQLMAVVVVAIMVVTLPLVTLQRLVTAQARRYATVRGKAVRARLVPLGRWRWLAFAAIMLWLVAVVIVPLAGITLRSVVSSSGPRRQPRRRADAEELRRHRQHARGRALDRQHRPASRRSAPRSRSRPMRRSRSRRIAGSGWFSRVFDYLVLLPRAMPGIVAGLAIFWLFLFVAPLKPLLNTLGEHLARLHAGLDAVRPAPRLERRRADRRGAGGRGPRRRRRPRPRRPRRRPAARPPRAARELAVDVPPLRARVLDRHLSPSDPEAR